MNKLLEYILSKLRPSIKRPIKGYEVLDVSPSNATNRQLIKAILREIEWRLELRLRKDNNGN